MNPVYRLFATPDSVAPTILRLLLAWVFAVHGGQHAFGWAGGPGWRETLAHWTAPAPGGLHFSYGLATAGLVAEVFGAVSMLLGFLTRLGAFGIFCVMSAAIVRVHGAAGFFAPLGYEYPLTLAAVALALVCAGGGRFSFDRALTRAFLPPRNGAVGNYYRLPLN